MSLKSMIIKKKYSEYLQNDGKWRWKGLIEVMEIKDLEYLLNRNDQLEEAVNHAREVDDKPWLYQPTEIQNTADNVNKG